MHKIIPKGWREVRLRELGRIVSGGTPDTKNPRYWDGSIAWLTPSEVNTKFINRTERTITETGLKNSSAQLLPVGSLIICTRATVGRCCINTIPITTNQGFKSIIPKNNNTYFLYYLLTYKKNLLIKKAAGSTFLEVSKKDIENLKLTIPPLSEQIAIAKILSEWDHAIDLVSHKVELKERLKKGLMQRLLTGKVRLKGFDGEWSKIRLGDLGVFISGTGFPEKEQRGTQGIPFYKVSDMNLEANGNQMNVANNYVTLIQIKHNRWKIIESNAVIFAKVGAAIFLERKKLAKNFIIDNNMMAFIPNINFSFAKILFDNLKLSRYVQVGAVPSYNATDLGTIKVIIPIDSAEQTAIAEILTTADDEISLLKKQLDALKLQKKGLMQKLLTGEWSTRNVKLN